MEKIVVKSEQKVLFISFIWIEALFFTAPSFEVYGQDLRKMNVVYAPPGMNTVRIEKGVNYKTADGGGLSIDSYYPPGVKENAKLPVVIFALGYPAYGLKNARQYISWGKLAALHKMVGITYETKNPETDLADLISFIRKHADKLGIDKERIVISSCSGNVPVVLSYLADYEGNFLKAAVFYYGVMSTPDQRYQEEIDSLSKKIGFTFPHLDNNDRLPHNLPLLVVRAGRDETPYVNKTIDHFLSSALSNNIPITFINYSQGRHAFDLVSNSQVSRRIIKQTLTFIHEMMTGLP